MTAVLGALRDLFLRPPEWSAAGARRPAAEASVSAVSADVAILAAGDTAPLAGAVVALAAARRARASCAVVCLWDPHRAGQATAVGLAMPAARRLAGRLAQRGVEATARGRIVHVALPADAADARVVAERVAATATVPLVTVIGGPRPAALDAFLAARERVIVAPAPTCPDGVAEIATVEAARVGRATGLLVLSPSSRQRLMAQSGWLLSLAARAAAEAALDGHAH